MIYQKSQLNSNNALILKIIKRWQIDCAQIGSEKYLFKVSLNKYMLPIMRRASNIYDTTKHE